MGVLYPQNHPKSDHFSLKKPIVLGSSHFRKPPYGYHCVYNIIWRFPKSWGYPQINPNHPFLDRMFHEINQAAIKGYPHWHGGSSLNMHSLHVAKARVGEQGQVPEFRILEIPVVPVLCGDSMWFMARTNQQKWGYNGDVKWEYNGAIIKQLRVWSILFFENVFFNQS